MRSNIH